MLFRLLILLAAQALPKYQETIVVTAGRQEQPWRETTAAVTVLRRDDLARLPGQHLGDALRLVPGLQLVDVNPGAPAMLSSRGFFGAGEVEYVQLLVDGIAVGDAESGLADWRAIAIEDVDRIEIVRGPASSLFGDAAIGGVIQVFRRRHRATRFMAGVPAAWGSDVSSRHASFRVSESEGFRKHARTRELFATVSFASVAIDATDRRREDPGPLTAAELRTDRGTSNALFAGDEDHTRTARIAVRTPNIIAGAHYRTSERTRTLLLAPGFGDRAARDLETFGAAATLTRRLADLTFGADVAADALRSRYGEVSGRGSRARGAAFVSGERRVGRHVRVAGGARFDAISDSFDGRDARDRALSPRIALALDRGNVTSYVQVARAFKAPTLDQRFDQRPLPDLHGGTFTISNPALAPQRARNLEAGVRGAAPAYAWELVAYAMDVEDEIDFDVRTFRYANLGRSRHRGLESMARWTLLPNASLGASYSWTRAQSGGRQLKNIAEHAARADAELRAAVDVHLSVAYSADRWLDDDNRIPLDDATVADVRIARTFASFSAALDVTNLTNARYAPLGFALGDTPFYYPAAGRALALTFSWKGTAP